MQLSDIVVRIKNEPSPIRQIMKMASKQNIINMGLDPDEIISYGGGWVGHHSPEQLREEYCSICGDLTHFHASGQYSPTLGFDECRQALADMEQHLFNVDVDIENIIIGQSSTQLTHDLIIALVNPGERILLFDPTYANYIGQIKIALGNSKIIRQPVLDVESWSFKQDDVLSEDFKTIYEREKPRVVIVPSPDNPSSQVFSHRFVSTMADICEDSGSFIAFDFAYKTQCFIQQPAYYSWSPKSHPSTIAIHSNSKWGRGLGRRFGWIDAHEDIIDALERIQQRSILCPDTLHQLAFSSYVTKAMKAQNLRPYLDRIRDAYKNAADVTVRAIEEHLGMPCLKPQGGLYTLMNVCEDGDDFVTRVLKHTGVLFIPGKGFGNTLREAVRISYGPHVEHPSLIEEGMKRVATYLKTRS